MVRRQRRRSRTWKDVWLNEGFATYAEWLWTEHTGGASVAQTAQSTLARLRQSTDPMPPPGDPGVGDLFGASVYLRGALTLQALRLTVGDEAFFNTLRTFASKFAGGNATTADFIAVATRSAGEPTCNRCSTLAVPAPAARPTWL